MVSELPPLVQRYVKRVLPRDADVPRSVRLQQSGELRLKPQGRWVRFTARQESFVHELAFTWQALVRMLPLFPIQVRDRHAAGQGTGEVRLLGLLRVARETGPHVSEGSALRYLAELPWLPHAMLANRRLEWGEVDAGTVEVATQLGARRPSVQLHFDDAGNIVRVWTGARPHKEDGDYVPRPWGGTYSDYEVLGGVRIPTRGEVSWDLPEGRFTWFRGEVTSLKTL